jgi:hypothetical protein
MSYTLTYSQGVEGWPSFYSYYPDFMIGMNQHFYTFKGGNLYRHNATGPRNTFYGIYNPSSVRGIINQSPIEKKVFKTIALETNAKWSASLVTDLETGFIEKEYFEEKEATFFAFIRGTSGGLTSPNLKLRSTQGIGNSTQVNSSVLDSVTVKFAFPVDSMVSIGDLLYQFNITTSQMTWNGNITGVNGDTIIVNCSFPVGATPKVVPTVGQFMFYGKDQVAESHGLRGDFLDYVISNNDSFAVELFAIRSDVFKSFP